MHPANTKVRVFPDGASKPRWARGNGDGVFKAMALAGPDKIDSIAKANKLDTRLGSAADAPNAGRRSMKLANMLRKLVKDSGTAIIGKHKVGPGSSAVLDGAFDAAIEKANAHAVPRTAPVQKKAPATKDTTLTATKRPASKATKKAVKTAG